MGRAATVILALFHDASRPPCETAPMSDTATNETDPDALWELMLDGSEELADELGLPAKGGGAFSPRALADIDRWVGEHDGALDQEDLGLLGMMLARILVETHDGGLA